jgi:hypothetical protein
MFYKTINVFLFFSLFLALSSCTQEKQVSPEDVAIHFFDALYNKKDITKAKKFTSKKFQLELSKYKTAKHAGSKLFNLSFDKVTINAALADTKLRSKFNKTGILTVVFSGEFNRKTITEMKRISLVKLHNTWLIDKLLPDLVFN